MLLVAGLYFGQSRTVRGTVVDELGAPMQGVSVEVNGGTDALFPRTDANGAFLLATPARAAILRRIGFMSTRVSFSAAEPIRVVLKRAPSDSIPVCKATDECVHNRTWDSALCFPRIPGVDVGSLNRSIDSVGRDFNVGHAILHVESGYAGYNTLLSDDRLWTSTDVSEIVYAIHRGSATLREQRAVDTRGVAADGTYWRHLSAAPESAEYSAGDAVTAQRLNRVIDGVCERADTTQSH